MPCLTPLLLAGFVTTLLHNPVHTTDMNGAIVEVQSCERGAGLHAAVSTVGVYRTGVQYGFALLDHGPASLTLTPQLGLGVLDHAVPELSTPVNVSVGAQLIVGYDHVRIGIGYLHFSNAGLGERNAGLDMLTVMTGWTFR